MSHVEYLLYNVCHITLGRVMNVDLLWENGKKPSLYNKFGKFVSYISPASPGVTRLQ